MTAVTQPPCHDELEVSIFGPGIGESVVVHLGYGDWIVVDSCLNPRTRLPAALEYPLPTPKDLRRLGERAHRAYCTRPVRGPKPRRKPLAVERTAREVAKRRRPMEGPLGHIRVRGSLADHSPLRVELFGPAFEVASAA